MSEITGTISSIAYGKGLTGTVEVKACSPSQIAAPATASADKLFLNALGATSIFMLQQDKSEMKSAVAGNIRIKTAIEYIPITRWPVP